MDNDQASQAVEIALAYIKKNPSLGLSVQMVSVDGNRTDSKKFLDESNPLNIYSAAQFMLFNYYLRRSLCPIQ